VELVTFEVYKLGIYKCCLDVSVSKHFHNVQYALCLLVFHGGFPVAHGVEVYSANSWILKFLRDPFSKFDEACSSAFGVHLPEEFLVGFRQLVYHSYEFSRNLEGPGLPSSHFPPYRIYQRKQRRKYLIHTQYVRA